MKYGNVSAGSGGYEAELALLNSEKESSSITEEEYKLRLKVLNRARFRFIVLTNGGYTPKKQKQVRIGERRDAVHAKRSLDIVDMLDRERKEAEDAFLLNPETETEEGSTPASDPEMHS